MSTQKTICVLGSFLSISLDDGSFECQNASHFESPPPRTPASEFLDLAFISERTAIYLSQKQSLCLHTTYTGQHSSILFDARESVKTHSCRTEHWGDVSTALGAPLAEYKWLPRGVLEMGGWPNDLVLISS